MILRKFGHPSYSEMKQISLLLLEIFCQFEKLETFKI